MSKPKKIINCKIQPMNDCFIGSANTRITKYDHGGAIDGSRWLRHAHNEGLVFAFFIDQWYDARIEVFNQAFDYYGFSSSHIEISVVAEGRGFNGEEFRFQLPYFPFQEVFKDWSIFSRRVLVEKTGFYL